jgi:ketosteroid isomerase-like protein
MKLRGRLLFLPLVSCAALLALPALAADPREAEVAKVHEEFLSAWKRFDADTAARMLSDDVVWVGSNGLRDKSTILGTFRLHAMNSPQREKGLRVRMFGDTALVTLVLDNLDENEQPVRVFVTEVWAKAKGEWKLVSFHSSGVPQKEPK